MKSNRLKRLSAAALAAAAPAIARAQSNSVSSMLNTMNTEAKSLGQQIVNVVSVVIGIAAAVLLIMIFIESNKAQSNSKDSLIRLFAVMIVSFVALELIKAFVL